MITIAVTGGIATGKSTCARLLAQELGCPFVSADAVVHQLYEDPAVMGQVRERFGDRFLRNGSLDRRAFGAHIFDHGADRQWLEDLLHPLVLSRVREWREKHGDQTALIEVPLLYEVDFPLKRDIDLVVACSPATQWTRLSERDRFNPDEARARITAQLPMTEKIHRANLVIWNEGSTALLARQTLLAAARIRILTP